MIGNRRWCATVVAAGVIVALGAAPAAAGSAVRSVAQPLAAALTGYQIVSHSFTDSAQDVSDGSTQCPSGKAVVGGGVVIGASTTAGTFTVAAVCVKKVAKRKDVQGSGVDVPAGSQTLATAKCPAGTVVLGGGGLATDSTTVSLNSSLPFNGGKGWRIFVNDTGSDDANAAVLIVCGAKPAKYVVSIGPGTTVGAFSQGFDSATCPSGTLALGGGGYDSSTSVTDDLNSSEPIDGGTEWRAYVNNTSSVRSTITAYAVCAQA